MFSNNTRNVAIDREREGVCVRERGGSHTQTQRQQQRKKRRGRREDDEKGGDKAVRERKEGTDTQTNTHTPTQTHV